MADIFVTLWGTLLYVLFGPEAGVIRADPITASLVVSAAVGAYGAVEGQDQARRAKNAERDAKEATKKREQELAAEAAAKEAAKKKAESAGSRAGFGAGGTPSRAMFTASGFNNVAEDNIRRGTLFGN